MFFEPVTNGFVLICTRGAYSEATLFTRGGALFAKVGKSYHKLSPNRTISGTRANWVEIRHEPNLKVVSDGLDMRLEEAVLVPLDAFLKSLHRAA